MCDQDIRQGIKDLQEWTKNHEALEVQKHIDMQASIVENTQILKSYIEDNRKLNSNMHEILLVAQFVKDMEGFVSILNRIKAFFKWLAGFAIVSASIAFLSKVWPFH
jgi:hypothetical protein